MGRQPISKDDKIQKMLAELVKKVPDLAGIETVVAPVEEQQEAILEGQAVCNWFLNGGEGFKDKHCKWCGCLFMYSWDVPSVAYCTIKCMKAYLESIGLAWTPGKPAEERWGKTRPAVIGPEATALIKEMTNNV